MSKASQGQNFLGKKIKIVFDRLLGSKYPRFGLEYPINYGHIPGVMAGDGDELDVYCLSSTEPSRPETYLGLADRSDSHSGPHGLLKRAMLSLAPESSVCGFGKFTKNKWIYGLKNITGKMNQLIVMRYINLENKQIYRSYCVGGVIN